MQRLSALVEDLPKVQEEWRRVMIAKQDLIDAARSQQLPSRRVLKSVCAIHNVSLSSADEADKEFANFKAVASGWDASNAQKLSALRRNHNQLLTPEELAVEVLQSASSFRDSVPDDSHADVSAASESVDQSVAPEEAREQRPSAHLTAEEFEGVSVVVRGRCKLEECNTLMDLLLQHAQTPRAAFPMTTAQLVGIGARVTGQTGVSRLATLRATKRITMGKAGVTIADIYMPR